MRYIIPVYVQKQIEDLESFETELRQFVDPRKNCPNTFEVHETKDELRREVYIGDVVRLCTTMITNCVPSSKIIGYDFNSEIGTYFIKIEADKDFIASGVFYPRVLINPDNPNKVNSIVGLDYVVRGVNLHENKS